MDDRLLVQWAAWEPIAAPYVFDADRDAIDRVMARSAAKSKSGPFRVTTSWADAYSRGSFGAPGDRQFELGLLPHPFCGDLRNATVYVLLLNPGLGTTDYYGEFEVTPYREAVKRNLKQDFSGNYPFLYLDPQFSWHGGFGWWHTKLGQVIGDLARRTSQTFAAARAQLAQKLASIELVPYHSAGFKGARWVWGLPSVQLARSFINSVVLDRVRRGEAIVIVTRKVREWNLTPMPGVTLYDAGQSRSAHLSPGTDGGRAILEHLT